MIFKKVCRIKAPVEEVFEWHERSGALERLSPPWDPLEVISKGPGIDEGTRVEMYIKAGPLPVKIKWIAEHTLYEKNRMFQDRQVKGPFKRWIHTHTFTTDDGGETVLEDRIDYALPLHPLGNLFGGRSIKKKLERIFRYRHATTARDLVDHLSRQDQKPLHILMSGAGGVVGSSLIPFFTTGGHRVTRLVRRKPLKNENERFWDPQKGILDIEDTDSFDVVIHLSGENIGQGRWSPEKKRKIIESRNKTTALIARHISRMAKPPEVFLSASAIGFYGDRGDEVMTEENECGTDFISGVCSQWENAAIPALEKGIRVVFLRIGVVLSPVGGALQRLLPSFKMGLGGKVGSGGQYMSWISMDDLIGTVYHAINDESLSGPVNIVAPAPVSNLELTRTLGKVISRPALFTIPAWLIKLLFGEMGQEILLASTRVKPEKILAAGYRFRHPDLERALRHLLGK
ncbi:MAG: TIGR01777 family oxidoreductase [Deltaproteobacteria bacterium]|nr:TIGR01777 family oxidoreductase [Deltaproteobacteria bacterium]